MISGRAQNDGPSGNEHKVVFDLSGGRSEKNVRSTPENWKKNAQPGRLGNVNLKQQDKPITDRRLAPDIVLGEAQKASRSRPTLTGPALAR